MKLLHVFPELGIGGSEKVILQISKFVIKKHKVKVGICTTDGIKQIEFENNGIEILRTPNLKNKFSLISNIVTLYKNIKVYEPDIIHTHTLYTLLLVYFIKNVFFLNFPIVHTGHGGPRKNYNKIASLLTRFVDKYITISRFSYDSLKKNSKKNNILFIQNGIDRFYEDEVFEFENKEKDSRKFKIAFIGRLTTQKGVEILIDSVSSLISKDINVDLKIIGDGELRENLENQVKKLDISENVYFMGYQSNPWKLVKDYPVIVMPSLWEPGGLVALEAISRNHTIVASNVEGLKDAIIDGENGYLFEPSHTEQLTELLYNLAIGEKKYLMMDKSLRMKLLFENNAGPTIYNVYNELFNQ